MRPRFRKNPDLELENSERDIRDPRFRSQRKETAHSETDNSETETPDLGGGGEKAGKGKGKRERTQLVQRWRTQHPQTHKEKFKDLGE